MSKEAEKRVMRTCRFSEALSRRETMLSPEVGRNVGSAFAAGARSRCGDGQQSQERALVAAA